MKYILIIFMCVFLSPSYAADSVKVPKGYEKKLEELGISRSAPRASYQLQFVNQSQHTAFVEAYTTSGPKTVYINSGQSASFGYSSGTVVDTIRAYDQTTGLITFCPAVTMSTNHQMIIQMDNHNCFLNY